MPWRAEVDRSLCASTGECVQAAPQAFRFSEEDDLAEVLPGVAELPHDRLLRVAEHCPTNAIRVLDEAGSVVHDSG